MRSGLAIVLTAMISVLPANARVWNYANTGRVAVGNRNVNVNRNANVNRNVNVNQNVNVNRNVNVNVHGGYYGGCCYYHDDPNWGAFAAGAAIGVATTAAVAAATAPKTTTTVVTTAAPVPALAIGTTVGVLPGGCTAISAPGVVTYNCNSVYYRPFYQGTTLVYQVVRYP